MSVNKLYNEDCVIGIKRIPTGSIDAILTDHPYLYLKNQKLDKEYYDKSIEHIHSERDLLIF